MKWLFCWNSPNSTEVNTESDLGDLKLTQMTFYDLSSFRYKNEASGKPASEVGKSKTESWNGKKNERNGFTCRFDKESGSNQSFYPYWSYSTLWDLIWHEMTLFDLNKGGENPNWFRSEANEICSKVLSTSSESKIKNSKLKMKLKWNGKRKAISFPSWPIHRRDSMISYLMCLYLPADMDCVISIEYGSE